MDNQTTNTSSEETPLQTYQKPALINLSQVQAENDTGDGADGSLRNTTS